MQLIPIFKDLAVSSDLSTEKALMKQVEKNRHIYEKQVISALKVHKVHTEAEIAAIIHTRSAFELGRFDLVRQLNYLDTQKKVCPRLSRVLSYARKYGTRSPTCMPNVLPPNH